MSTYDITLTDPLRSGFMIQPGGFDGPGGSQSNSSLRLYGRGALEWGEAVDEDLIRLVETFAGSTPPLNPLAGQLWHRISYYWHDSSAGVGSGWWRYDPQTLTWARLNGTGVVATAAPSNPTIGSYYLNATSGMLYRWDTAYKQAAAAWMPRYSSSTNLSGGSPTSPPEHTLRVWDAFGNSGSGQWVSPSTVAVNLLAPTDPQVGTIWYDQTSGKLKVWNGTVWVEILGPSGGTSQVMSTDLDMNGFNIFNVHDTTINGTNVAATNARTVYNYVTAQLAALGTSISGGVSAAYLPLTGGTLTGALTINTGLTVNQSVVVGGGVTSGNLSITGSTALNSCSVTYLSVGSDANMNSHKVTNVATPTASGDAVNKGFLDSTISGLGLSGLSSSNIARTNYGGTPHDGDIRTSAPNNIEIYCNGSWFKVFPAQWA